MNQTQRSFLEIPLLLLFFWIWQSLEIKILQLPFGGGALQIIPILATYIALTRTWTSTTLICFLFFFIESFNVGYSSAIYIAIGLWTALFTKLFSSEFAVEGRQKFMLLAGGAHLFNKILTWFILHSFDSSLPMWDFSKGFVVSSIALMILAYAIFPFLVSWDEYFEHPIAESRDLNPDVLR